MLTLPNPACILCTQVCEDRDFRRLEPGVSHFLVDGSFQGSWIPRGKNEARADAKCAGVTGARCETFVSPHSSHRCKRQDHQPGQQDQPELRLLGFRAHRNPHVVGNGGKAVFAGSSVTTVVALKI